MREKSVENEIKAYVRDEPDSWIIKIHADGTQGKETLDIFGALHGVPFFIDVKKPGGVVEPMQNFLVERAKRTGYISGVPETLEEFKEIFKTHSYLNR